MSTATDTKVAPGTLVRIYKNLHRSRAAGHAVYSVQDKKTGLVVDHAAFAVLADARFLVSEAGRQRALRDGHRNVHAFVEGVWTEPGTTEMPGTAVAVTYSPFRFTTFVAAATEQPVHRADVVELGQGVLAWGIS